MKYSVCLDCVFMGQDPIQSMKTVKDCGYEAVEFWGWESKDIAGMASYAKEAGLKVSAFCTVSANIGDRSQHELYLEGLEKTVRTAKQLDCPTIITTVGQSIPGVSHEDHHQAAVEALRQAAPIMERENRILVVEPLNPLDHPGYHMPYSDEAFQMIDEVSSPNVKVLFDIYHQQVTEGDVVRRMLKHLEQIGHIHVAGNPGRGDIIGGELNYAWIFDQLKEAGYDRYIGLEYLTDDQTGTLTATKEILK